MPLLTNQTIGNIPIIHNYEYTDLDEAQGATWSANDVGKVFRILDEPNYYIILNTDGDFAKIKSGETKEVQTTDATVTSLATLATTDDYTYIITAEVQGAVNTGGNTAGYGRAATFKNVAGTLSQVGSTTALWTHEDAAGWDCDIDADGTDIRIRVTGAAATTIDWLGDIYIKVQSDT